MAWTLAKFIGRYLVIGAAAWAVLVPLRAHPLGLFAGVTAPVAAIAIEAVRLALGPARQKRRQGSLMSFTGGAPYDIL